MTKKLTNTQFEIPAEFTEKVNSWRGKYKKIKYLDVNAVTDIDKEGNVKYTPGLVVFFRMPTRQEMSAAENLSVGEAGQMDIYKKAEKLMVDCYLGGQLTLDEILNDIETYMAVAEFALYRLVERKNVNWGNC